jgi:hypothetical protein
MDRNLNPSKISLNQIYNIIKEEAVSVKVTLDEVRNLFNYAHEKVGDVATVANLTAEEIDLSDLINAIMDVSVNLGDDPEKPNFNETV